MTRPPQSQSRLTILGALLVLAGVVQVVAGAFANPVCYRPLYFAIGGIQVMAGLVLAFWPRVGGGRER